MIDSLGSIFEGSKSSVALLADEAITYIEKLEKIEQAARAAVDEIYNKFGFCVPKEVHYLNKLLMDIRERANGDDV